MRVHKALVMFGRKKISECTDLPCFVLSSVKAAQCAGEDWMIDQESCCIGIELGSTRIKAVMIGPDFIPVASGSYSWKDHLEGGYWTYGLDEVEKGLRACYGFLKKDFESRTGERLHRVASIGISAMMHGLLAFDDEGCLLTPFRTWRNTTTSRAAAELTRLFGFNIPQRWSIAHLYQSILDGEPFASRIAFMTTLSGYVHQRLTGEKVLGIGDASGMFPIDPATCTWDAGMAGKFMKLTGIGIDGIFPKVLKAGENAGVLSSEGASWLDVDGDLEARIPLAPPEGDAGTGMSATDAVRERTGNVSAGTSIFSMVVLERMPKSVHEEIDIVTTPTGRPVAMVHCNNCTTDMNSYVSIIQEAIRLMGGNDDPDAIFTMLYEESLKGSPDCGGFTVINYISGEPVTGFSDGRPLIIRRPDRKATLADFARAHLYSALATLSHGMEILRSDGVRIDRMMAHGGLFRHPVTGSSFLAGAVDAPVHTMRSAGEGGPYGMALLASYMISGGGMSLEDYLDSRVFCNTEGTRMDPDPVVVEGFRDYLSRFLSVLPVEKAAIDCLPMEGADA